MVEVLNKAGPFSANSEVVIAAPSIHLSSMMCAFRPEIAVSAEDVGFKKGYGAFTGRHHVIRRSLHENSLILLSQFINFIFQCSNCLSSR